MNAFANLVDQLKPDTLACLQAVCLRNHSLSEIEASARTGPMEPHLKRLTDLGLMVADQAGKYWYPSFDGRGVAHWDSQKRSFPAPHPEPRLGENGDFIADQPCDQYRALFNSPGYCWCGHFRTEHVDHG